MNLNNPATLTARVRHYPLRASITEKATADLTPEEQIPESLQNSPWQAPFAGERFSPIDGGHTRIIDTGTDVAERQEQKRRIDQPRQ